VRILITGSRVWVWKKPIQDAILDAVGDLDPSEVTIVHGGANGADTIAALFAIEMGYNRECHHAEWDLYGKRAGAIRNAKMAKAGADICLAFPTRQGSGTQMMIGMAKKAGIEVKVYES